MDWAHLLLILFAFYAGVTGLLRRPEPGEKWWNSQRFHSLFLIGWGLLLLSERRRVVGEAWGTIVLGGLLLLLALWMLLAQPAVDARKFRKQMREHEAARASLAA